MSWVQIGIVWLSALLIFSPVYAGSSTPIGVASSARTSKATSRNQGPLVILDCGHGGSDEGAKVRQLQEKTITLLTGLYTKKVLEELGYRILLTRSRDIYVSLPKRVNLANRTKGTVFVSIHFNSAKNTEAEGIEVFFYREKNKERCLSSQKLASCVLNGILSETGAFSRGVKAGNFYVIRETQMPAIIVEAGFMTNHKEWESLRRKSHLESISKGIAQGIDKYLKQ